MVNFPYGGAGGAIANGVLSGKLNLSMIDGGLAQAELPISGINTDSEILLALEFNPRADRVTITDGNNLDTDTDVTGIADGDTVYAVTNWLLATDDVSVQSTTSDGTMDADLFQVTAADTIRSNTTVTNGAIQVFWKDLSKWMIDRTSVARVSSNGNIMIDDKTQLATVTTGLYDDVGGNVDQEVIKTAAFANYDFNQGDVFYVTAGTTTLTESEVATHLDDDTIQMVSQLHASDIANLGGYILRGTKGSRILVVWTDRQPNG